MPRTLQLGLSVNGEAVELSCAGYKTLLEALREDLGLTGTSGSPAPSTAASWASAAPARC